MYVLIVLTDFIKQTLNLHEKMARKQLSNEQRTMLIEYIEEHPELVKQKHCNQYTNADSRKLWVEVTQKLNAVPGATKGWKEWKKVSYAQNKLFA